MGDASREVLGRDLQGQTGDTRPCQGPAGERTHPGPPARGGTNDSERGCQVVVSDGASEIIKKKKVLRTPSTLHSFPSTSKCFTSFFSAPCPAATALPSARTFLLPWPGPHPLLPTPPTPETPVCTRRRPRSRECIKTSGTRPEGTRTDPETGPGPPSWCAQIPLADAGYGPARARLLLRVPPTAVPHLVSGARSSGTPDGTRFNTGLLGQHWGTRSTKTGTRVWAPPPATRLWPDLTDLCGMEEWL